MPVCAQCGKEYPADALELSFRRPDAVVAIPESERGQRLQENNDLCIIDRVRFFIRGVLPLPVEARAAPYNIGLWAEVNQSAFERIYELWSDPDQANEPPFQAELANSLPNHVQTVGLRAELQLTGPTTRPHLIIKPTAHLLYREQSSGVSAHRTHEYSSLFE